MEVALFAGSLAVWAGVWVLVVKLRGQRGKLAANGLGAVLGFVAAVVLIAVFAPDPTPEQAQARAEAARVEAEKERLAEEEDAKRQAEAEKNKDRSTMAAIICSNHVKNSLKSPSSADFPFGVAEGGISRRVDQVYLVRSYVDAQNAFGAQIRNWYTCGIQYRAGEEAADSSWALLSLQFDK